MTKDASMTVRGETSLGICSSVHRAGNSKNFSVEAYIAELSRARERA